MRDSPSRDGGARPGSFDLEATLQKLPRVPASDGFTERVVAAARQSEPDRGMRWSQLALRAAGLVALLGGALLAGVFWSPPGSVDRPVDRAASVDADAGAIEGPVHSRVFDDLGPAVPSSRAEELAMLRARFSTLRAELDELQRLASEADPVVDLGSGELGIHDEPVDYLLDLRALLPADGRARRASYDR